MRAAHFNRWYPCNYKPLRVIGREGMQTGLWFAEFNNIVGNLGSRVWENLMQGVQL